MPIASLNNGLYTALSGIQTTQTLLNTTSRNIVNAQTPGYVVENEQSVTQAATGGVAAGPIQRFISASLQQSARTNNGETAYNQALSAALTQMDQLSGDPSEGTSLTAQINTLQTAFQQLATNPQASGTADTVLDDADQLAQTFNAQTDAIQSLQQTAQGNVVNDVAQVNKDLQQIASLNQQVVSAEANGANASQLQDQRDTAVNNLSSLMGVNAFIDNQGVLQVLSSNYQPLAGLYAEQVSYNQVNNTISTSAGTIPSVGGDIGGNLQVLTGTTVQALQNLSEIATNLTLGFQGLPTSSLELNGQLEASAATTVLTPVAATTTLITNNGNQYTASLAYQSTAGSSVYSLVATNLAPVGSAPAVSAPPPNLVLGTVDMSTTPPTFSGQQLQLTPAVANQQPGTIEPLTAETSGLTTGAAQAPTQIFANNTMTLFTDMAGALPPAGGPFTPPYYSGTIQVNPDISATALAIGDQQLVTGTNPTQGFTATPGSNAGAAAAAASMLNNFQFTFTTTGIAGTQSLESAAGAVTIGIGQSLANSNNSITSLTTAATQIQQAIAPQSEVNLDTQMGQLVVLQNAYAANARVVTTVASMLDTLVELGVAS
jgi:flagellar hook-associated protein 1 FlgK